MCLSSVSCVCHWCCVIFGCLFALCMCRVYVYYWDVRRLLLFGGVGDSVYHRCVVSVVGAVWCINLCMRYTYGGGSQGGVPNGFVWLGESAIVSCCRCVVYICMYKCVYDVYTYGIPDRFFCLWDSALVSVIEALFICICMYMGFPMCSPAWRVGNSVCHRGVISIVVVV